MQQQSAIDAFLNFSKEERFKGWPLASEITEGPKINFFGSTIEYKLTTPVGEEPYTSIIRSFGWAVVFGLTADGKVITLCQWKPGVNCATWELPPGGIGKIAPGTDISEIERKTQDAFLKETGYGNGTWSHLGHIMIETGKYRGAGPDDHGLPAQLFLAENLEEIAQKRSPNPNEIIETIMVPFGEFREVLASGLFTEASAVACAYKALENLGTLRWS